LKAVRDGPPWFGVRSDGDPNCAFVQYAPYVLFGGTYWALRVTIALWTLLTLCAGYLRVKQMFGARVALFAMLLTSVAHLLVHFGRHGSIVMPAVFSSFLTVGLLLKAQRTTPGRVRALLFALSGMLLAANLYEYAAAKAVFAGVLVLWLFSAPYRRTDLRPFARETLLVALGLLAGAVLVIEPPTSYHYIVLVPLALIFAALCLDWIARARFGPAFVTVVLVGVSVANLYLYFGVYPYKGAWYSLESDVGY